jgi:glycosyltransferase involved in cell wall biosynthesis
MKISIVTISFNQEKYLRQCIESILSQTDCNLEYIVVDPGSTDGSRALIESYGDRIIKVFEPDQGPADGLNQGFKFATGEILGFINSDDYLLPNALKHVDNYFAENGLDRFVTGHGYTEAINGRYIKAKPVPMTARHMLNRSAVMFQQTTFFPASAFRKAGGFNIKNTTCWDYELFLKFLLDGLIHEVIPNDLAVFRLHEGSISGSGRLTDCYLNDLDRIFTDVCGRQRNLLDKCLTYCLRLKREASRRLKSNPQ